MSSLTCYAFIPGGNSPLEIKSSRIWTTVEKKKHISNTAMNPDITISIRYLSCIRNMTAINVSHVYDTNIIYS